MRTLYEKNVYQNEELKTFNNYYKVRSNLEWRNKYYDF